MAFNFSFLKGNTVVLNNAVKLKITETEGKENYVFDFHKYRYILQHEGILYHYYSSDEILDIERVNTSPAVFGKKLEKKGIEYAKNFETELFGRIGLINQLLSNGTLSIDYKDEYMDYITHGVVYPNSLSGLQNHVPANSDKSKEVLMKFCLRELSEYKNKRLETGEITVKSKKLSTTKKNLSTLKDLYQYLEDSGEETCNFKLSSANFITLTKEEVKKAYIDIEKYRQACFTVESTLVSSLESIAVSELYLMAVYASPSIYTIDTPYDALYRAVPETTIKILFEEELSAAQEVYDNSEVKEKLKTKLAAEKENYTSRTKKIA